MPLEIPTAMTDAVVGTPEEEVLDGQQPAVEVSLETPKPAGVAPVPPAPVVDPGVSQQLKSLQNQLAGARRINEKLQQDLMQSRTPTAPVIELKDDLDKQLFSGDPTQVRAAIRVQAQQVAQEIIAQERQNALLLADHQQRTTALVDAQQTVINKYKDLDPDKGDPDSPISKAYAEVLSKDPALLRNPYGPIVAMQRMEDQLKQTATATGNVRRVNGSLPPSRPTTSSSTITLSRDQKAFCDRHGLEYASYAKTLNTLNTQGGVEI